MKRTVAVFVLIDKQGRVLLQHRTKDAPTLPNYWAFFGGGIDPGETPEQAVRREAKEELQIELQDLTFFRHFHYKDKEVETDHDFFTAPLTQTLEELRQQQCEGDGLDMFTYEETLPLLIAPFDRIILKALFKKG